MRTVAAGVVLLLAAVAGCSSSDATPAEVGPLASGEASAPASASQSVTSTPDDSAIPTDDAPGVGRAMPAAARTPDAAGASAFARYYIETMNGALANSDVTQLQALSDPGCGGCTNVVAAIAQAHAAGHRVRGAELVVEFVEAPAVRNGETIVDLRYKRPAGEVLDAQGNVVQPIAPEGSIDTQLRVRYLSNSWSVLGFRQVPD